MPTLSDLNSLFATLALNLQTPDAASRIGDDDEDLNLTISNLNRSLNLSETQPGVKILNTALSLLCFTAPEVFQSELEHLVNTIVAVLSSSIECKVLKVAGKEILRVGGSFSSQDCLEVMEMCADILERLEGHQGDLSPSIVYAALRVAVSPVLDSNSLDGWKNCVQKLLIHVSKEGSFMSRELPERLLFWYLDPVILQHDISQILQEAKKRCFLRLRIEFHERIEWRSILICLALAPSMFIEARDLLHSWFLLTGLAFVLELQTELVSLVLDILSRPMSWGLSMETSLKLPFSHAYFPIQQKLLRTMAGTLSWENFQHLVHVISGVASHAGDPRNRSSEQGGVKIELVDHYSLWAIAMNFPGWFFYATILLFCSPKVEAIFQLRFYSGSVETDKLYKEDVPYSAAAARFIAWMVIPTTDSYQDLLVEYLVKVSDLGNLKGLGSENFGQASRGYKEECEFNSNCIESTTRVIFDGHAIWLWLSEFQDMCFRYFRRISSLPSSSAHKYQVESNQTSRLIRRIPLGILIGFLGSIDEIGCELLLHYATTGATFQLKEAQTAGLKQGRRSSKWQELLAHWSETCSIEEAIAGARVVFDLTDVIEEMSCSLFENEDSGINFLVSMKLRTLKYLLKCVNRLLQADEAEDRHLMFGDLCRSLVHWGHQGKDVLQDCKDLEDSIMKLRRSVPAERKCASA